MSLLAVIDTETTGLYPYRHDRIVEIGVVMMQTDGRIVRAFDSLINPERDIGPTSIHGLSTADVLKAPRFADMTGLLVEVLDGSVAFAGHNIRFDLAFLAAEFSRQDYIFPAGPSFCTLELAGGGSLCSCCADYGITYSDEAHTALHDARAAAQLLAILLADAPQIVSKISQLSPIAWPQIRKSSISPVTRETARLSKGEPPSYLQRLLARVQEAFPLDTDESGEIAYAALIDRAIEDRCVDQSEGDALCEMAVRWGISGNRVREIHQCYLDHLTAAALADGKVTDSERRDLSLVAHLLGVEQQHLHEMLDGASQKLYELGVTQQPFELRVDTSRLAGSKVCFTGEFQCHYCGTMITRETAATLAMGRGMNVVDSVTKKLDLLIVADPNTQSGKAKKARQYGIRIMHEPVFWRTIGIEVE